ncbi:Cobalamin synthase [Phycicoccus elongatus Lp2]|uniref:Adenosylcobinamide-GDP ribazoletransferase n=1 Tax=Phycicoccus elongatus Lp2 TaxID=1193181 RepID=N0E400_9MICO|nr:adenosylcobinamide-GDP ribazoletransferase [Phycicoccus elongatus]CCH69629.1 Cobalamin synthase [Phycicoccus elongatus Lp2]
MLADAWRLAVGTLTVLPVRAPTTVDRRRAGWAMLLAPLAVLPLALAVGAVVALGRLLTMPAIVVAVLAVGTLALGSRALHLDGLSDTADGLTASYDPARSLAVMKGGTAGPAGVVAVVLVLGLQAAAISALVPQPHGAVVAGLAVCMSRAALAVCCVRGVGAAREDGLGRTFTQTVTPWAAAASWAGALVLMALATDWAGLGWWRGVLAGAVALAVVALVLRRTVRRFGGVTGDVFGACIELGLAGLLVALS